MAVSEFHPLMLAPDVRRRAERRVGTTLCRKWHLDSVVGCGGMATVYAATHRNQSRVAVKILHPELSIDDQIRARFLREGYLANSIDHPGAVAVIDDDETEDGTAFLVMELLSGETLEQRLRRPGGGVSRREALNVAEQLLEVLRVAHEKGVVHRDIKPDNLFITTTGHVKVLDFGIARLHAAASGSTGLGAFYGTPGYAPPEQARGRSDDDVDARSDLYAVGATLFAMLSGRPVHEAETATERLALTISLPAPSITTVVPDLPLELTQVIDKALRYERAERWPDAQSMLDAIRLARPAIEAIPETEAEHPADSATHAAPPAFVREGRGARLSDRARSFTLAPRRRKRRVLPLLFVGVGLLLGVRALTKPSAAEATLPSSPGASSEQARLRGLKGARVDARERALGAPAQPDPRSEQPPSSPAPSRGAAAPAERVASEGAASTSPEPSRLSSAARPAPEKTTSGERPARKASPKAGRATTNGSDPTDLFTRRR